MDSFKSICSSLAPVIAFVTIATIASGCAPTVSVRTSPPPPLPFYEQPYCPGPGYIWVPGYWAYGTNGYYWVPGIWELAPYPGCLWTPGYWGWSNERYVWHSGYWGRHIGFYGGINYGYGYTGSGYSGGYWRENDFYYNTAVTNVNVTVVAKTYSTPAATTTAAPLDKKTAASVSYNGGAGGIIVKPAAQELIAIHEQHIGMTQFQKQHVRAAAMNRELLATENRGLPRAEIIVKPQVLKKEKNQPPKQKSKRNPKARKQDQKVLGDLKK